MLLKEKRVTFSCVSVHVIEGDFFGVTDRICCFFGLHVSHGNELTLATMFISINKRNLEIHRLS